MSPSIHCLISDCRTVNSRCSAAFAPAKPSPKSREELCVSAKTVSTYKARILEKMQMPHEAALVRYAVRHKLFDDNDEA